MNKVSIIVPVYNGQDVLGHCLDSILKQDYQDIEVLVVDDGSKDDSYKVIKEYAKKDSRVIPIHKENGGVSSTRNCALERATGKYIQFVDVDDWLPFDSTKLLVRAMEENDVDMVIGDFYRVVDDKASKKGSIRKSSVLSRNEYADKMMITPADLYYGVLWNKLYKKEIIDEYQLRMDQNISYSEDMIFNLEYLLYVKKVFVLKSPVYYYVKNDGSLVAQNLNIQNTVKMKTTVIQYYMRFYENILSPEDYEGRKPILYGFLVSFSTDFLNIPFLNDTKHINQENREKIYLGKMNRPSVMTLTYLSQKLWDQLIQTASEQFHLDLLDGKIAYYLYEKGEPTSLEELYAVCEERGPKFGISIAKLIALGYVKVANLNISEDNLMKYEYIPGKLDSVFENIASDFEGIVYRGISKENIENQKKVSALILKNLKKTLAD